MLKEELIHHEEIGTNLLKEVESLLKKVDILKKMTEEKNNVKQNQLSEFQPQIRYRKQIVEIEKRLPGQEDTQEQNLWSILASKHSSRETNSKTMLLIYCNSRIDLFWQTASKSTNEVFTQSTDRKTKNLW